MNKLQKSKSGNGIEKVKKYTLEQFFAETSDWVPGLAKTIKEGCNAMNKDGGPDWHARHKFIKLMLEYSFGKPKEMQEITVKGELPQIFIGNLKGENDEEVQNS